MASTNLDLTQLSVNWKKLQEKLKVAKAADKKGTAKRKRPEGAEGGSKRQKLSNINSQSLRETKRMHWKGLSKSRSHLSLRKPEAANTHEDEAERPLSSHGEREPPPAPQVNEGVSPTALAGRYIALDCEMVGVGPEPDKDSQLARVSIVNYHGHQLYDSYVKPVVPITDYRTHVSGIRPHHMKIARSFKEVQSDVATFLQGRVLIGHAVKNDLQALMLQHPKRDTRDTSRHAAYRSLAKGAPSLKRLAAELLGLEIQTGEHSSIEDARVCMLLYRRDKDSFEATVTQRFGLPPVSMATGKAITQNFAKRKSKKKRR